MKQAHVFNLNGRREHGLFYLGLIQSFEKSAFIDPKCLPIFTVSGDFAKSYAADIFFHQVLDGLDPMSVIDGRGANKMYLEARPMEAVGKDCFDDGTMTVDGKEHSVSVMFRNDANLSGVPGGCSDRHKRENRHCEGLAVTRSLIQRFSRHTQNKAGGIIFAAGRGEITEAAAVDMYSRAPDINDEWGRNHVISVRSSLLHRSEKFQRGWSQLVDRYGAEPKAAF